MKLNIMERLMLLNMLPQKGDIVTLRTVNEYMQKIGLNEEEIKLYEIVQQEDGRIKWNSKYNDRTVDISFGDIITNIIANELKEVDKKKELTGNHMSLYEKFVEGKIGG